MLGNPVGLLTVVEAVLAAPQGNGTPKSYAERLGWGPKDKVIFFHCDDAGMSHASNMGTIECMTEGFVTSTSVMMPCPWVPEFAEFARSHSDLDIGVHLTMNAEWDAYRWGPVAGKPAVPSLVDPDGYLWDLVEGVAAHATPDDVEREIRAQIEKAEAMGIPITHIDTHMAALFARKEYVERYMKVGVEKGIPVLAAGGHLTLAAQHNAEAVGLLRQWAEPVWDAGLPVIDDIHASSYDWKVTDKVDLFIDLLRSVQPGITMIVVHCSRPTDDFPLITSSSEFRLADLEAMTDPRVKKVLDDAGFVLTTWKELKARRERAK